MLYSIYKRKEGIVEMKKLIVKIILIAIVIIAIGDTMFKYFGIRTELMRYVDKYKEAISIIEEQEELLEKYRMEIANNLQDTR